MKRQASGLKLEKRHSAQNGLSNEFLQSLLKRGTDQGELYIEILLTRIIRNMKIQYFNYTVFYIACRLDWLAILSCSDVG